MDERNEQRFGLSEDELIAIITVLLAAVLIGVFFWRSDGVTPRPVVDRIGGLVGGTSAAAPLIGAQQFGPSGLRLEGTAAADAEIAALIDSRVVAETTADAEGDWSLLVPTQPDGSYELLIRSRSEDEVVFSEPMVIDFAAQGLTEPDAAVPLDAPAALGDSGEPPDAAAGTAPTAAVGTAPQLAMAGGFAFGPVLIEGTAAARERVQVLVDGETVGTVAATSGGQWRYLLPAGAIAPGVHSVVARGSGAGVDSGPFSFNLGEPDIPTFDDNYENVVIEPGIYTLRGRATPQWPVQFQVNDNEPQQVMADSAGRFAAPVDLSVPGIYRLEALAIGSDGNPLPQRSSGPVLIYAGVEPPEQAAQVEEQAEPVMPLPLVAEDVTTPDAPTATEPTATEQPARLPEGADNPVMAALIADGNFNTLVDALAVANLGDELAGQPLTLFAPTDDAFAGLPEGTMEAFKRHPDRLRALLAHHVAVGTFGGQAVQDVAASGTPLLQTVGGNPLPLALGPDGGPTVGGAAIVTGDLAGGEQVVHAIDGVLLPPVDIAPPQIDASGVATFRGTALTVVGSAEPNTVLSLELNDQPYGASLVGADGRWEIGGTVSDGEYIIIAYSYDDDGILLAQSEPLRLIVTND